MLTERERKMVNIMLRLSHWNRAAPLGDHPVKVLKGIIEDTEKMLDELEKANELPIDASSENPGPNKTEPPGDR